MENPNFNFTIHDTVTTEWFQFEPGDRTRYVVGLSRVPRFISGVNDSYIQVITIKGFYQFQTNQFEFEDEKDLSGFMGYFGSKLNIGSAESKMLILFISEWLKNRKIPELQLCHDCGAKPGEIHSENCDVERCSVCGGQRLSCECEGHDKAFARWTGIWPGYAEVQLLGITLNDLYGKGMYKALFIKP